MTTMMIVLGDQYADGHGMYEEFHVSIPDQYSLETLQENFQKAVKAIGVNLDKFAADYEDYSVSRDDFQPLLNAGFTVDDYEICAYFGDSEWADEDDIYLDRDSFVGILMFLYGYGLPDFVWYDVPKPPQLNKKQYAYGLFSH